jgi:hypothetical protein
MGTAARRAVLASLDKLTQPGIMEQGFHGSLLVSCERTRESAHKPHFAKTALARLTQPERMGAAESRAHLEESSSVPVLTINGEIEDETGREAGFASEVTPEQAAAAEA